MARAPRQQTASRKSNAAAEDGDARRILRAEMQRRGVTYKMLARMMSAAGAEETERNLISRVSRGSFSFGFALRALRAMGVAQLDIRPVRGN